LQTITRGPRQRQHRHQFRLAAGFQTEAIARVRGQRPGDRRMLVDLDRIDRGVTAGIVPLLLRLRERRLQLAKAVAEDLREPHQQRQFGAAGLRRIDHRGQRGARALRAVGMHHDAALRIDIEIPLGPVRDRIGPAGVVDGPDGHGRVSDTSEGRAL
jgi:hypothetical protein